MTLQPPPGWDTRTVFTCQRCNAACMTASGARKDIPPGFVYGAAKLGLCRTCRQKEAQPPFPRNNLTNTPRPSDDDNQATLALYLARRRHRINKAHLRLRHTAWSR